MKVTELVKMSPLHRHSGGVLSCPPQSRAVGGHRWSGEIDIVWVCILSRRYFLVVGRLVELSDVVAGMSTS